VGGAKDSRHLTGDAADLATGNLETQIIRAARLTKFPAVGAIGLYPDPDDQIIHTDQRPRVNGKVLLWVRSGGVYNYDLPPDLIAKLKAAGAVDID
jgi:uncharacterized protein YcbK (DUF882 family)